MKYTTPKTEIIYITNVVATSEVNDSGNDNNYGGGIQLPFIPG